MILGLGTHLFVKVPPVKCLAQGHNKRTCQPIFTLTLLNAECQAGNTNF